MATNELDETTKKKISKLRDEDTSIRQVSKKLDVSRPTVRKYQDYEYSEADLSDNSEEEREVPAESGGNPQNLIKSYKNDQEVSSMSEKEEQEQEVEEVNYCGNCGETFEGEPSKCPECKAQLDWENVVTV